MKSMTGYGEAAAQGKWAKITAQLRSLNHRYLDIQVRAPKEHLALEEEARKLIRDKVSRGRVELFITRSPLKGRGQRLELDEDLMGQYLQALRRARKRFALQGEVDLSLIARLPDLFRLREVEVRDGDERGLVLRTVESALRNLDRSREREGRHLSSDIQLHIHHLQRIATELKREAQKIPAHLPEPLSLKEERNSAEALKGDIHEEVVRIQSHVQGLARLIRGREPVGKRIDFLSQEIHRELSTISAKTPHLSVVQRALEGKERVEKVREQAQNIE